MGTTTHEELDVERFRDQKRFQDACSSSDDTEPGAPQLPWGVKKRLQKEAPATSGDRRPQLGDEVAIHFTAKLMNGTQIGSSRDAGASLGPAEKNDPLAKICAAEARSADGEPRPFKFVIGREPREIVQGLELGVMTMRKGEVARFKVAPRYAYDDLGCPPLVPPDAALTFEVELLGWVTKRDLFCDLRAIKTVTEHGSGQEKPVRGQDVLLSLTVRDRRNKVIEEHAALEHSVCAQDFGALSRIVASTLMTMVEGEQCSVKLSWDATPERKYSEATLELALTRVFEFEDCSPGRDGSLMKKVLKRAAGDSYPRDGGSVTLRVTSVASDAGELPGFSGPLQLEFRAGDGEVCDALEFAVLKMKVGEEAALTCEPRIGCCEPKLGLTGQEARAVLTVELLAVEACEDPAALPLPERLSRAAARKEVGGKLFGRQRFALALARYEGVLALVEESAGDDGKELRRICELNRAACFLKLNDPSSAKAACSTVLLSDPSNVKALYRRASANFVLSNYAEAMTDVTAILNHDPRNAEARGLAAKIKEARKEYSQQAKSAAARMVLKTASGAGATGQTGASAAGAKADAGSAGLLRCLAAPCARLCGASP